MTEPLCPRCRLRPRHRASGGRLEGYCGPCAAEYKRLRRLAPPASIARAPVNPTKLAADARRARAIAEGRLHVVADLSYAEGWTRCSCGETFVAQGGRSLARHQRLADAFNAHADAANRTAKAYSGGPILDPAEPGPLPAV